MLLSMCFKCHCWKSYALSECPLVLYTVTLSLWLTSSQEVMFSEVISMKLGTDLHQGVDPGIFNDSLTLGMFFDFVPAFSKVIQIRHM